MREPAWLGVFVIQVAMWRPSGFGDVWELGESGVSRFSNNVKGDFDKDQASLWREVLRKKKLVDRPGQGCCGQGRMVSVLARDMVWPADSGSGVLVRCTTDDRWPRRYHERSYAERLVDKMLMRREKKEEGEGRSGKRRQETDGQVAILLCFDAVLDERRFWLIWRRTVKSEKGKGHDSKRETASNVRVETGNYWGA